MISRHDLAGANVLIKSFFGSVFYEKITQENISRSGRRMHVYPARRLALSYVQCSLGVTTE